MSFNRRLTGGCQCGRNHYIIEPPPNTQELPRVFFDTAPTHSVFQATPLPAFIRIPLTWYKSSATPFFDDETSSTIRRAYTHYSEQHSKRSFCGFCGTPLSYWSEQPATEAEYICVTLGSLSRNDLGDLEELGLLPDEAADTTEQSAPLTERGDNVPGALLSGRETLSLPWFDTMLAGSRLGTMRMSRGASTSRDARVRVEWEVREWTSKDDDDTTTTAAERGAESPNKKPRLDDDTREAAAQMEGVERQ